MKPVRLLDLLILLLLTIWLMGGLPWPGHWLLTHGADPRRAALLVATLGAAIWPAFRKESLWLEFVRRAVVKLRLPRARIRLGAAALALVCLLSVLQLLALRVPLYDVGLFHQILWAVSHGQGFLSTVSGAGNFLLDHLAPSLALLAPFYWIGGASPFLLPLLHPLLLAAGVSAWVWLASRLSPRDSDLPGATLLFALFFESLWGNLAWGFHELTLSFACGSWAFALYFEARARGEFDRTRRNAILVLLVATSLCKEILLVDIAFFLGVVAFEGRRRKRVAPALLAIAVMLIAVFAFYESQPHPADKNYFDRYYSYLGHGLQDFALNLLLHPWRVVTAVGAWPLIKYALTVFLPWLGLPFRSPAYLAAILASLASSAIATYPPLRGANFHYVLALWPMLACLTVLALSRRPPSSRLKWAWVWLAFLSWDTDPVAQLREYAQAARLHAPVIAKLREIQAGESVAASELAGPWVSGRARAYRWPEHGLKCPDWIILQGAQLQFRECPAPEGWHEAWSEANWHGYRKN